MHARLQVKGISLICLIGNGSNFPAVALGSRQWNKGWEYNYSRISLKELQQGKDGWFVFSLRTIIPRNENPEKSVIQ